MELQTIEKLPIVSLEKWANCVENILYNKPYCFDSMLKRVGQKLDISLVADRYSRFILRQKDATS